MPPSLEWPLSSGLSIWRNESDLFVSVEDHSEAPGPLVGFPGAAAVTALNLNLSLCPVLFSSLPHKCGSWGYSPVNLLHANVHLRVGIHYPCVCMRVQSCLSVTLWTVAYQAPLTIGFSGQGCWSGLPFPTPGDLPSPGIEPLFPALAGGFFTPAPPGKPPLSMRPSLKLTMH